MNRHQSEILRIIVTIALEVIILWLVFWLAYALRSITDGIPFVQLRIPHISEEYFFPFVALGILVWVCVFMRAGLYSHRKIPIFEEIRKVIIYAFFWFLTYIGIVYLTQWFLFVKEIPRLIIFYTLILGIFSSIIIRSGVHFVWKFFTKKGIISPLRMLILKDAKEQLPFEIDEREIFYELVDISSIHYAENVIRKRQIDAVMFAVSDFGDTKFSSLLLIAKAYGVACVHPKIMPYMKHFSRTDTFVAGVPVVSLSAVSITPWQRIIKRIMDIIFSLFFLILAFPIMLVVYIGIWLEDSSGPIIYRNRRIWQDGKIFTLFKFRYMYWRFCTKEEYLREYEKDEALEFEENLKKQQNTRTGPLYKIKNDPRKMRFGKIIEKFSIDELPQLVNVLLGNMSLVGPRPHQPREVALYDESDRQVLTIKPGITGMAQVYGRDKNSFKEEVAHDIYYIENYSILLDIMIIFRTILVVLFRPFEKK